MRTPNRHIRWAWLPWERIDRDALYAITKIRQEVFVVEQDCAYADLDGKDPKAFHLLGHDTTLLAYARVFLPGIDHADAVIGRVIVKASARGTGLGRHLMEVAQQRVFDASGPVAIHLSAQAHLRRFYERLGYQVDGEGYLEDGIPHLPMRRTP